MGKQKPRRTLSPLRPLSPVYSLSASRRPAVYGEVFGIAAGADIGLALVRFGHHGLDSVFAGIGQRRFLAVKAQPHLALRVGGGGPAHQRINLARAGGGEIQNPVLRLALPRGHGGSGGLIDPCAHGHSPDILPLYRQFPRAGQESAADFRQIAPPLPPQMGQRDALS